MASLPPVPGLPPQPLLPLWPLWEPSPLPSSTPHPFISWAQLSSLDLPGAHAASRQPSPGGALSARAPPGGGPALALRSSLSLHPHPPLAPCCLQFSGHLPLSSSRCWSSGPWALVSPLRPGGRWAQPCAARCGLRAWPALQSCPQLCHCAQPQPSRDPQSPHMALSWDPRRLHQPVQEPSLPWGPLPSLLLRSDPPSILAGPHAHPALASRGPGHAQPSPPVSSLCCSLMAHSPHELPSPGQQRSWCGAPCPGSVPALVPHRD